MRVHSSVLSALAVAYISTALATSSHAAIIDSFDTYPGSAGDGWTQGWGSRPSTPTGGYDQTRGATTSLPDLGGGSYLKVSANNNGASASNGTLALRRPFDDFGAVAVDQPYIVRFDYRADVAFIGSDDSQRYGIWGSGGGESSSASNTSGNNTWVAMVWSGATGASDVPGGTDGTSNPGNVFDAGDVGKWIFLNNTSASTVTIGSTSMSFANSGITMVAGTKYHFEIEVDPINKEYKPSVSDGVNSFTSADYLGFRNQNDDLTLGWLFFGLGLTPTSADLGYSVDNVEITVVPEPNALVLASIGIVGLAVYRSRRK
jgi:hypothetical protein